MFAQWKCMTCPTVGHLAPKTEPLKEPKMTALRSQDPHTGKMYDHPVQEVKDLSPRISIIQLRVGDECVSIQLCRHCVKGFREKFTPLWNEMEKVANGH